MIVYRHYYYGTYHCDKCVKLWIKGSQYPNMMANEFVRTDDVPSHETCETCGCAVGSK